VTGGRARSVNILEEASVQKAPFAAREGRETIINLLREQPRTSRAELVSRSGLSKATVSEITNALLAEGFVREVGKLQINRGRSRVLLELQPRARLVFGAQLDDRSCTAIIADLRAEPQVQVERPVLGTSPEHFINAICACVEELRPQLSAPVLGLGIGVPASVDPNGRRVTLSVPYGWRDIPFAELVEERLQLPVLIANRAKVAALGELWQGANPGVNDFVYVYVGDGIVAGIVANGALYFGSAGGAGELGHLTVVPDGQPCGCGNHGCLHTVSSISAILRAVRAKRRDVDPAAAETPLDTLDDLLAAVENADPLVLETIDETGVYLGLAIANVINLLNPSLVVIGGPVARFGPPLITAIRREVRRRALRESLAGIEIVLSTLAEQEGAIGAAALVLDHLEALSTENAVLAADD
jgi:predicted NBD/HSP70 family sugar kinase